MHLSHRTCVRILKDASPQFFFKTHQKFQKQKNFQKSHKFTISTIPGNICIQCKQILVKTIAGVGFCTNIKYFLRCLFKNSPKIKN